MIRARLNWALGPNSGDWGWIVAGQPNFDPITNGRVGAHDILEHMRPTKGTEPVTNELQALGALAWGRGQAGDFDQDPGRLLALEVDYHAIDCFCELDPPPRPVPRLRNEQLERWITMTVTRARHTIIHELDHDGWGLERRRELRQTLDAIAAWLRTGVRRAKRRYPTLDPGEFVSLFHCLQYELDPLLQKHGEEGDYITVQINPRERTVKARLVRRFDE